MNFGTVTIHTQESPVVREMVEKLRADRTKCEDIEARACFVYDVLGVRGLLVFDESLTEAERTAIRFCAVQDRLKKSFDAARDAAARLLWVGITPFTMAWPTGEKE